MKTPIRPGEKVVFEPDDRARTAARWRRNSVAALTDGVTVVPAGRAVSVYFRQGDRALELQGEMGARDVDLIIWMPEELHWINVTNNERTRASREERDHACSTIQAYLSHQGMVVDFDAQ